MSEEIQKKIQAIFDRIEIQPEYDPHPIKIKQFTWNKDMDDFIVTYAVEQTNYMFRYNAQLAAQLDADYVSLDPVHQLEQEVKYIKRMYERGIGAKEYYPFTDRL